MIPSLGRRSRVLLRTALALILAVGAHVSAQEDVPVAPAGEQPVELGEAESGERALEALDAIVDSLEIVEKDLKAASDALANKGLPETEKERLEAEIAALNEKKAKLDKDFAAIASGISATDARGVDGTGKLDLGQEFNELLLPIVTELKEATRQPREVEQLRSDLRDAENRYGILSRGLENVDAMMRSAGDSPALLAGQVSRPYDAEEVWFPCQPNDWVRLSDGTLGKVLRQTPEFVQLVMLGGGRKSYLTPGFLALVPENISGGFRIRSTFGIDFKHQAECTTTIPETLWKDITRELLSVIEREQLHNLKIEFKSAGASSLDYEVIADLGGDCASKHEQLTRVLQRACVNACNTHGWVIPFTQITVHHAPASA